MLFIVSSALFSGFEVHLNPLRYQTLDDIAHTVHEQLLAFLQTNKLSHLAEKARLLNFHIHDYTTVQEIHNLPHVYVCDHCTTA